MKKKILLLAFTLLAITQTWANTSTINEVSEVIITESAGWLETAFVKWQPISSATGYNVYYKESSAASSEYKRIDGMLIRKYEDYYRADVVGLKAGNYIIKVVAILDTNTTKQAVSNNIEVKSHIREGFAFASFSTLKTGSGAYNDDGTLRSNANVLYITPTTANTVTLDVITNNKGGVTPCTGIGAILKAREKGYDSTPLAIRIIGNLTADKVEGLDSNNFLNIKGKGYTEMNTTLEGIGDDATINGWGILVRGAANVEIRNLGIMLFPEDGISLDTNNENIWIHNNDIFYGKKGSGDKAKGDGSLDLKGDSKSVSISYNHFWDSGKASLCGMKSESVNSHITYHHNWFDHSDSRHPRVRTMTVHVYNNYFDGNSKYGVGATMGSSVFVENNYFRNCKYPMLISLQGTDIINGVKNGTFSGENGGMIKAFGNYMTGQTRFVDQTYSTTDFDAIVTSTREETVPATYKTKTGGTTYNNFDTNPSIIYSYNVQTAEEAKADVMSYAGRINGGDVKFTFTEADDKSSDIDASISNALVAYTGSVIKIGDEGGDVTNISTNQISDIALYPNPVVSYLHINTEATIEIIEVYNLSGVLLKRTIGEDKIDMSNLDSGSYLAKVLTTEGIIGKVIMKK